MSVVVRLVRHAESTGNAAHRLVGHLDLALSPRGEEQARELAERLAGEQFDSVWSSDLTRALTTARLGWGEPTPTQAMREMDFGTLDGMAFAEIAPEVVSALLGFETFEAPGGESLESLRQRVTGFLDGLPKGRHMVFTHGGVIRTVGNLVGHRRFVGNTGWMEVSWTERRLIEVSDPAGWRQG